jgi:peptide/nickel transport system substrate-binding protein
MTGLATIDENGEFPAVLAQELPTLENGGLSDDFLTVTWKLMREDLKWSDGEALTSDDVRFTIEVLIESRLWRIGWHQWIRFDHQC